MENCFFCEKGLRVFSSYHEIKCVNKVVLITNLDKNISQLDGKETSLFIEYCPFCGRRMINEE